VAGKETKRTGTIVAFHGARGVVGGGGVGGGEVFASNEKKVERGNWKKKKKASNGREIP